MRNNALRPLLYLAVVMLVAVQAHATTLSGAALVGALRQGGHVLVMRHANAPAQPPEKSAADPENVDLERQLDDAGRTTARAMGEALRKLGIPIGDVISSPTYRTRLTIRLAALGEPRIAAELAEGARDMTSDAGLKQSAWLRARAAEAPAAGKNTVLVTHAPNITGAFGEAAAGIAPGEAVVLRPDGKGGADIVARIKIEEWPQLAAAK